MFANGEQNMKKKITRVIIAVSGGVVTRCRSTEPNVEIELFDRDNMREEGIENYKIDEIWKKNEKIFSHAIY